ncbi:flagellar hook-basal body protein [candidate division KSB1 bacterium]
MSNILRTGYTGMMASKFRGNVAANNIANINSAGYKKRRARLSEVNLNSSRISRQNRTGAGVKVQGVSRINAQGGIYKSGSETDMAVAGEGYFQVEIPGGRNAYMRNGSFKISPEGIIVSSDGYSLQPPILIPPDALNVFIGNDGRIQAEVRGQTEPILLGQIELVRFQNPQGLKSIGNILYEQTSTSGEAITGVPAVGGFGKIVQGYLEDSNVDMAEEQINLIIDQRTFQTNANIIKTADEMMKTTIDLKR